MCNIDIETGVGYTDIQDIRWAWELVKRGLCPEHEVELEARPGWGYRFCPVDGEGWNHNDKMLYRYRDHAAWMVATGGCWTSTSVNYYGEGGTEKVSRHGGPPRPIEKRLHE